MYVYADIFLLLNITLNGIILVLTAWGMSIEFKVWRVLAAAGFGSAYAIGTLYFSEQGLLFAPLAKFFVSIVIVKLAFSFKTIKLFATTVACFYVVSFFLGGAVIGWLIFLRQDIIGPTGNLMTLYPSWQQLFIGISVALLLVFFVFRRLVLFRTRPKEYCKINIVYNDYNVNLNGLADSGNQLFVGTKPVVVVTYSAIEGILSEEVRSYLQKNSPEDWLLNIENCMDTEWLMRVEIIPFRSVGKKSLLLGFRPDCLIITAKDVAIKTDKVIIGIYRECLAEDGSYQALINPEAICLLNAKGGTEICA